MGFNPNATERGRLAGEIFDAMDAEMGSVSSVAGNQKRWGIAYRVADRLLSTSATLVPDEVDKGQPPN